MEEFARDGVEHIANAIEPNRNKVIEQGAIDIECAASDAARLGLNGLSVGAPRAEHGEGGVPKCGIPCPSRTHSVGDFVHIYRRLVDCDMEEMVAAHV